MINHGSYLSWFFLHAATTKAVYTPQAMKTTFIIFRCCTDPRRESGLPDRPPYRHRCRHHCHFCVRRHYCFLHQVRIFCFILVFFLPKVLESHNIRYKKIAYSLQLDMELLCYSSAWHNIHLKTCDPSWIGPFSCIPIPFWLREKAWILLICENMSTWKVRSSLRYYKIPFDRFLFFLFRNYRKKRRKKDKLNPFELGLISVQQHDEDEPDLCKQNVSSATLITLNLVKYSSITDISDQPCQKLLDCSCQAMFLNLGYTFVCFKTALRETHVLF